MADPAASTPPAPAAPVAETPPAGLTSAQVAEQRARGLVNAGGEHTSRSVAEILRANIFSRFNFLLGTLLAVILVFGQPQDALFGIVLVTNALIGIGQELRAKRTLDRLAVLSAPRVRVIRDGTPHEIAVADLVAGDLVDLRAGDQLAADGVVRASTSLEADESLLTGESEPVGKRAGDRLLSGSFVAAGSGGYQATGVGAEAYARQLAAQARRYAPVRSELMDGINRILRYVTWAIGPVAVLLVISAIHGHQMRRQAATGTVAALVGMVPQGLVLLTSVAFGVAAVTLARRRVLVQQLPAVEGLARVDVLCLDKTGTLTDGTIGFDSLIRLDDQAPAEAALGALADDENRNATLAAVGQEFPPPDGWPRQAVVPFSSARKWSAASFAGHGSWVLGAPEMVLPGGQQDQLSHAAGLAASGRRVLVLARAAGPLDGESLPQGLRATAFVLLAERLRSDAAQTIAYFAAQGVALKVISGDSPLTVSAVAARAGLPQAGGALGLRPGDTPAETGDGHRPAGPRPHGGDDRRRRQRRAGPQARRHRHRHGLRRPGDQGGRRAGAARQPVRHPARRRRRRPPGHGQHRTRRQPVHHQNSVGDAPGRRRGRHAAALPVPAPPPDDHRHPGHRNPVLLPRARAEHPALPARIRPPGAALRHPGRHHHRRGDIRRLRPGPGPRSPAGAAAHRRHPGHPHPQPVRAGPARHPADLAQDRTGRRRPGRVRAAIPGTRGAPLLRAAAAAQRARNHAGHRRTRGRCARGFLGPVPPARPRPPPVVCP
jgi:hypothetical protein